jgi:hypothetical protein
MPDGVGRPTTYKTYVSRVVLSKDVGWEIEYTDQFEEWWTTLTMNGQAAIDRAVQELAERGSALGRPWVDTITGS